MKINNINKNQIRTPELKTYKNLHEEIKLLENPINLLDTNESKFISIDKIINCSTNSITININEQKPFTLCKLSDFFEKTSPLSNVPIDCWSTWLEPTPSPKNVKVEQINKKSKTPITIFEDLEWSSQIVFYSGILCLLIYINKIFMIQ